MTDDDKLYRTLSVRLNSSEFAKFEKIKELLQEKTRSAGVYSTIKNPDVIKHLITLFFNLEENEKGFIAKN
jgi:excinuclease UvrABC nuclease subunit